MSDQATNDDFTRPRAGLRQHISRRSVVGVLCASAVGTALFRDWSTPGVAAAAPTAVDSVAQANTAPPSYQAIIGLL
jgi:hypothetical protein